VSADRAAIERALLEWMRSGDWSADDARFDELARALFAFQYAHCAPYKRLCDTRGRHPNRIGSFREIPAAPTGAFKELALRCFDADATCKTFRTSGTSLERRGELHLDTLELYEASLRPPLERFVLDETSARWPIHVLAPSAEEAPDSSLSHMFEVLVRERGAPGSSFHVHEGRLDVDGLVAALGTGAAGRPLAVLGTAFAFVHLFEGLEARDHPGFQLPAGSVVMETGGFKGRTRELTREALHAVIAKGFGLSERDVVNQYGMTELGSQFYDDVRRSAPDAPRAKQAPPWTRVRFVSPESGEDVAPGEVGMIVIHDLANTGSLAAIQTADLGRAVLDAKGEIAGFEVLGRASDAEARGCSIAADAMLGGAR